MTQPHARTSRSARHARLTMTPARPGQLATDGRARIRAAAGCAALTEVAQPASPAWQNPRSNALRAAWKSLLSVRTALRRLAADPTTAVDTRATTLAAAAYAEATAFVPHPWAAP